MSRKTYYHILEKGKRGEISTGESWVRSCGSHCKSERAFCHGSEANKGPGPTFEYTEILLLELGAEWVSHNGLSEHQDLVYGIVTAEAANLALLCPDIRRKKPFQPSWPCKTHCPPALFLPCLWSGSCNGTWLSKVLPVSMETGKQHQTDGHAP